MTLILQRAEFVVHHHPTRMEAHQFPLPGIMVTRILATIKPLTVAGIQNPSR